ncbi:UDP-N-acetylmuramoyl-L-alanyl-D-glutamate--2,6-diaminopimelate ligase [Blattabacterium cuenoti]|uniref:UDP-N-acetylmuramoyl-L-alanyl-D-glutamate--2, 6-diaminopimelate ligase n=1 Tax=Blattabacterium cuenoti TaxID=1653831 RepID=UPI00163C187C|nr:UDP-N-acetylmuramoyl-L-alanyl-D-glutamate--2,6-diaminopimelate ligase [Blattabacterium cuenoti]
MKKSLRLVLKNVNILKKIGTCEDKYVFGISIHSNMVKKNMIFVAIQGKKIDGHIFIIDAIRKGANTIVCEQLPLHIHLNVMYVLVLDSIEALGMISSNFYENPTKKIKLIGITGTNGKTSVAFLLHKLFSKMGEKNILISTIGIKILSKEYETIHTTPNIIEINKYLYLSIKKQCKYAFMEVSSHGIHQKRISRLFFQGGVFTNITHDHLDYHISFDHYLLTKTLFFKNLSKNSFALINYDDVHASHFKKDISAKIYSYGLKNHYDFHVKILHQDFHGTQLLIDKHPILIQLIGKFNAYNILSSYAVSILLGIEKHKILKILQEISSIKGRFEQFESYSGIRIIVDYAHNPNGLEEVLTTIEKMKQNDEKLICVIGCGGNRDKKKRSLMGKIAYEKCDVSIFTSDNPREEDPNEIIKDMKNFQSCVKNHSILTIVNRRIAIKKAIQIANKKDVVLIAGKGHENYQEIKGHRYAFNDMNVAKEFL